MKVEQSLWTADSGWKCEGPRSSLNAQLLLVFGSNARLAQPSILNQLKVRHPNARVFGCSTAGEIHSRRVCDDSISATAIEFEHTTLQTGQVNLDEYKNSREAGRALARQINCPGLAHVLVLSDGVNVNGSELTKGLSDVIASGVGITGGLSGDGDRFRETLVCHGDECRSGTIVGVGLVGHRLEIGYGSGGGWSAFGPRREITRSAANVLFELDHEPALSVYKKYLGDYAAQLPSSALLFPLSVWSSDGGEPMVRTILGVDEANGSMTFAGDVPEGHFCRLMKTSIDALVEGASDAARRSVSVSGSESATLALLISCVGRKLILRNRVDEEVDVIADELSNAAITSFYSYGEICPGSNTSDTSLHNQSMTVTTICEV